MQRFLLFITIVLLGSCELFQSREARTEKEVEKRLDAIDWSDVEKYPHFDECDETATKEVRRICFQEQILKYLSSILNDLKLEALNDVNDTVYIDFIIDEDSFIYVESFSTDNEVLKAIPNFKEKVSNRFKDLSLTAATKQGIPVKMKFRLPLVINTTN